MRQSWRRWCLHWYSASEHASIDRRARGRFGAALQRADDCWRSSAASQTDPQRARSQRGARSIPDASEAVVYAAARAHGDVCKSEIRNWHERGGTCAGAAGSLDRGGITDRRTNRRGTRNWSLRSGVAHNGARRACIEWCDPVRRRRSALIAIQAWSGSLLGG